MSSFGPGWTQPLVGVPFVAKGTTPDGWDCWGLMRWVYREHLGVELPDFAADYDDPLAAARVAELFDAGLRDWIEIDEPHVRVGDGVLVAVHGRASHCGVVVSPTRMLHVLPGCETSVTRLRCARWKPAGFYRWREIATSSSRSS